MNETLGFTGQMMTEPLPQELFPLFATENRPDYDYVWNRIAGEPKPDAQTETPPSTEKSSREP
ncbi:MAG: hypothetical protein TR69_WS6001000129 [candidate division WS6 bacterium OLB20]|uniref:Uncharacterized protein n=1 Tax=candidate division WS6 bacterium OLB20 TaxID=1617426 RepID=A0A136M052_9BACT|nr:MAG: hypothetical protein TR69_WS6001000129 [candidate division WS6 bacterium OLB20]